MEDREDRIVPPEEVCLFFVKFFGLLTGVVLLGFAASFFWAHPLTEERLDFQWSTGMALLVLGLPLLWSIKDLRREKKRNSKAG